MDLEKIRKLIPEYVVNVSDYLIGNGFEVFLVGGAPRDLLMDREPKDYDLATNATPEQVAEIFPRSVTTNARFGTVLVIMEDINNERFDVEVTTYRKEADYYGGRWPSKVEFTSEIEVDLSRRDFTINAIGINLVNIFEHSANLEDILVDPFDGYQDIQNKIIRAVREPVERFSEDGLRAYKACRLASELGFEIEENTFSAMKETLHVAQKISPERIRDELMKLLKYSSSPSVGINLMKESGLLKLFLPELLETIGMEQPEWHEDDVYTHSLKTLDLAEDSIKLVALLHDIGKARTMTKDEKGTHFYGHDKVGAEMAKEIMTRLRFSQSEIVRTMKLIRWHMFYYPSADWRKQNKLENLSQDDIEEKTIRAAGWTDSAIRRFIQNVGEDLIEDLFKLRIADANANPKSNFDPIEIQALEKRIADVRAQDMALSVKDLNITGHDLMNLGITSGPEIGKMLNYLLDEVIEDPLLNKKETLLELISKKLQS